MISDHDYRLFTETDQENEIEDQNDLEDDLQEVENE